MNFLQDLPDFVQYSRLDATFALEGQQQCVSHPSRTRRQAGQTDNVWVHTKYLGEGAQGSVVLQTKKSRRPGQAQHRAVKRIRVMEGNFMFNKLVLRELEAIFTFSQVKFSELFVKSHAWYTGRGSIFIAMDYHELGDLGKYLQDQDRCPTGRLQENEANEIASQVLNALALMHEHGFSHRDLKPENILIQQQPPGSWMVKVGDFGISKKGSEVSQITAVRGTATYIAPELVFNDGSGPSHHPYALDMWALGATVFKLLTGNAMFTLQTLALYSVGRCEFPKKMLKDAGVSDEAITFVSSLAAVDATKRPTSDEALDHPWMEQSSVEDPIAGSVPTILRAPDLESNVTLESGRHATSLEQHDQSPEPPLIEDPEYTAMWPDEVETITALDPRVGRSHEGGYSLSTPATSAVTPIELPHRPLHETLTGQLEEEADVLFDNKEYAKAELIYTGLVESRGKLFGGEHPNTVGCSYKLANSVFEQNRFGQAEALYREVVEARERKLGKVHTETLAARSKLGMAAIRIESKQGEGETILRDVLSIQKAQLSLDHPDTLDTMAALAAHLVCVEESVTEARQMLRIVFQRRNKMFGEEHPKTLESAKALVHEIRDSSKRLGLSIEELESIHWLVLKDTRKAPGAPSQLMVYLLGYLVRTLLDQNKHNQVKPLYEELISRMRPALGEDDWTMLELRYELAHTYLALGETEHATEVYKGVIELARAKEEKNPLTCHFVKNFCIYLVKGHFPEELETVRMRGKLKDSHEYEEVVKLLVALVPLQKKVLGESHKDTIWSMNSLVKALAIIGGDRAREAEPLYRDLLRVSEEKNGTDHRDTLSYMHGLAVILSDRGEPDAAEEAVEMLYKLIFLQIKTLAQGPEVTIESMYGLLKPLHTLKRHEEAADTVGRIYSLWETTARGLTEDDMPTASRYAQILEDSEKYEKLEVFLGYILRYEQKTFGGDDPKTLGTASRIKGAGTKAREAYLRRYVQSPSSFKLDAGK